jgi:hypothetical protein
MAGSVTEATLNCYTVELGQSGAGGRNNPTLLWSWVNGGVGDRRQKEPYAVKELV